MISHGIVSARYATADTSIDASVMATRSNGKIEARRANDDIDGGGMLAYLADSGVIDPFTAPAPTLAEFDAAIREHINAVARSRDFDDGNDAAGFATSTKPEWAAESAAFIAWRDQVWLAFEAVKTNLPETTAAFVSGLPSVAWP